MEKCEVTRCHKIALRALDTCWVRKMWGFFKLFDQLWGSSVDFPGRFDWFWHLPSREGSARLTGHSQPHLWWHRPIAIRCSSMQSQQVQVTETPKINCFTHILHCSLLRILTILYPNKKVEIHILFGSFLKSFYLSSSSSFFKSGPAESRLLDATAGRLLRCTVPTLKT